MGLAVLLIGTRKGLMIARSTDDRHTWTMDDFQFLNQEVYSVAIDTRGERPRILAGVGEGHWGPLLTYSDDLGKSWTEPEEPPIGFPQGSEASVARVWQIQPATDQQPDVIYAGVEPHALFRSEDRGESFAIVQGLWEHPDRPSWVPGGGGACLHTVLPHPTDPDDVLVAMSAAGVYRTRDGGATWHAANRGIQVAHVPEDQRFPEFGQCVHKVAFHPDRPQRLFAQNHFGVYRSEDRGDSWTPIESGLPSNFGFAVVAHPRRPDTLYLFPLQADAERFPPEAKLRVYRTEDAGENWEPAANGLPTDPYYAAVLRDAMVADSGDPVGVYFGTRLGEVYASRDDGDSWSLIASHLPDILSVRVAEVA
jgi:photosystem II stability/assembly factor-like uncharacterized protein